jgi:hypothetical protein
VFRLACRRPPAPGRPAGSHDVGVELFQWNWESIARECTDNLGPAGIAWGLAPPPNEHVTGPEWWTSYQPVSYRVESRLGTRGQFRSMVSTCHAAGVDVLADAVVNHMTGRDAPGVGWAGSSYRHYDYPGLYSDAAGDFHHRDRGAGDDISNYPADDGPVQDASGLMEDARCGTVGPAESYAEGDWVCQHRWPAIAGMVAWRSAVGDAPLRNSWAGETGTRSAAAGAGSSR